MKKIMVKIIAFFSHHHFSRYVVEFFLYIIGFIALYYLLPGEVSDNVIGVVIGFLSSTILLRLFRLVAGGLEDVLKINYDTDKLLEIYSGCPDYRKTLESNGTKVEFAYADVLVNDDYEFTIVDAPDKFMELDGFIEENYAQIFSAHSNSAKTNLTTIRLDRFDAETKTFYLSRSTYFNHLVTNRAVDFPLFEGVSLRTVYEYGPRISSLEDSKMSNHIGINALVFLSDGRLLVPRRKGSATISKNKITSSIAVMLNFPSESQNDPQNAEITVEYLLHGNIIKNLSDRVKLPSDAIDPEKVEVKFLGFGQNIYEGGKPQFYFAVTLKEIDTRRYFEKRSEFIESQKKEGKKDVIDVDKTMYVADYSSFRYVKSLVKFNVYNKNGKKSKIKAGYERSYLCNLWHFERFKEQGR